MLQTESVLIKAHQPCEDCGSSDALAVYDNGTHCFSCDAHHYTKTKKVHNPRMNTGLTKGRPYRLKDRGISQETMDKYGCTVLVENQKIVEHIYPYYDPEVNHVANKLRRLPKDFRAEGDLRLAGLFGQNLFPRGSAKSITITEGEIDCLSAFQMQGSKYPVVSLKNGAASAARDIKHSLEYLESFEKVYLCFDADEAGQKAAIRCAQVLSPGKAQIVKLDPKLKDANGYLVDLKIQEFQKAWWNAELYTPAGILASEDLKDRIRNRKHDGGLAYPWEGLNAKAYGIRKGEAVILTAETGVGKTAFIREIEHHILVSDPESKIGTIFLEETPEDSGLGLMSVRASIPFHLPDATYTPEEYTRAEQVLDGNRVFFYDSFGSTKVDEIIARVRYLVKGLDCKYILIDHLSIIVSDQQQGDERKKLDEVMTKLKTLTIELDMALIAVVHMNRQGQIRGTAAIEQLANIVIQLDRDKLSPDPGIRNTTFVTVTKNRFSGRTGPACALSYDDSTGRLSEVEPDLDALRELTSIDKMEAA